MNRKIGRLGLLLLWLTACTQVLDFDRGKIPDGDRDSGKPPIGMDGGEDGSATTGGGKDGSTPDAGKDAGNDASMTQPDAQVDSGPDGSCSVNADCTDPTKSVCVNNKCEACDTRDHAGCPGDQLCCDGGGVPTCTTTSLTSCAACDDACNDTAVSVADACVDRQCACGSGPACNPTSSRPYCYDFDGAGAGTVACLECRGDTDCDGNTNGDQCVDGTCVECDPSDDSGCSAATPICNATKACEPCTVSGMCPGTQSCDPSGYCSCMNNTMCTSPTTPLCNVTSKQCQGCTSDTQCAQAFPGTKTQCLASGECAACDPTTGANNAGCNPNSNAPICGATSKTCRACTGSDCTGATPVCAPVTATSKPGQCVRCDATGGCAAGEQCTATNTCVDCINDMGCSAPNDQCNTTTNVCIDCDATGGCTADQQCRLTDSTCVDCTTDAGCSAPNDQCNTTTNTCVDCDANGGCAAGQQCRLTDSTCVDCTSDAGCSAPNDQCNTTTNMCVDCDATGGCATGQQCRLTDSTCVDCTSDAGCSAPNDQCNTTTNMCVDCDATGGCAVGEQCRLSDNSCVDCLTDADCTTAAAPLCNAAGACVACNATGVSDPNARCAADQPGTVCATSGFPGQCRACDPADDQGCSTAPNDQCSATTATCIDCDATGGCAVGELCRLTDNTCVECLADATCPATAPLCENGACVACDAAANNDTRCATKVAGTVCSASGVRDGQCTDCDPGDATGCAVGQQCLPADHSCVDCIDNASTPCAGNLACIANDCVACATDASCTGHPSGAQCVTGGQCRACDPADNNVPCTGTTPICNATTFSCVACTADAQCGAGLFCVPGGSCAVNTATCDPLNGNADCATDPLHPTCTDVAGTFYCR